MLVKFLKRVNANEQEVQGGQKIPRLQGAANIPVESDACHGYSSNWPKKLSSVLSRSLAMEPMPLTEPN